MTFHRTRECWRDCRACTAMYHAEVPACCLAGACRCRGGVAADQCGAIVLCATLPGPRAHARVCPAKVPARLFADKAAVLGHAQRRLQRVALAGGQELQQPVRLELRVQLHLQRRRQLSDRWQYSAALWEYDFHVCRWILMLKQISRCDAERDCVIHGRCHC